MRGAGDALRAAGVGAIYLVHGTFAGTDALGLFSALGRVFPGAAKLLRGLEKAIVDGVAGENGNYTAEYARLMENALCHGGAPRIPVRLFHWSSENHHLGRADAAVRLLDELHAQELPAGQRVILWGHSHAGNVFALLTNLLGADAEMRAKFFGAAEVYYRWPLFRWADIVVWDRIEKLLRREGSPLAGRPLDIVTFGTPIRYGWDAAGHANLLHFVHHRPAQGHAAHRAHFPLTVDEILNAEHGDYVQHFGIAGTNAMPPILAWRAWRADRNLHALLQPHLPPQGLLSRLKFGVRVADAGETLLVDYGRTHESLLAHLAGHAVYTRREWLLFHTEELVKRWYATAQ
jgi:hypothetical protein